MKRILPAVCLLLVCCVSLTGCAWLVVGGIGAVGGYAVTRDTMQGEYDAKFSDAWKAAQTVCSTLGVITSRDTGSGVISATVDNAKVKVMLYQITPEAIRLKVKARKGLFPRLGTAEKVFVKIVQHLM